MKACRPALHHLTGADDTGTSRDVGSRETWRLCRGRAKASCSGGSAEPESPVFYVSIQTVVDAWARRGSRCESPAIQARWCSTRLRDQRGMRQHCLRPLSSIILPGHPALFGDFQRASHSILMATLRYVVHGQAPHASFRHPASHQYPRASLHLTHREKIAQHPAG